MSTTCQPTPPLSASGMRVTLIQMDIAWGDITANCDTASRIIDDNPGSQLYVLPEMFSTGFATEPEGIADDSLKSLRWMQQKANAIHAAICGSVATKAEDGTFRNRFYFVKPNANEGNTNVANASVENTNEAIQGEANSADKSAQTATLGTEEGVAYYDKHHLFTYGGEQHHFTAGNKRVIVEWMGVRFLLQICYDLRFPCYARNIVRQGISAQTSQTAAAYDCAIYVASWPTSRIDPWRALLKARAIENQCYVLGVDRIGTDPACTYCGGTEAIDPYGRVIAKCPDNEESTATVEIDMDALTAFRQKFPVLNDAD